MENKLMSLEELNSKQWECVNPDCTSVKFVHVLQGEPKYLYVIIYKRSGIEGYGTLDRNFKLLSGDKEPFVKEVEPKVFDSFGTEIKVGDVVLVSDEDVDDIENCGILSFFRRINESNRELPFSVAYQRKELLKSNGFNFKYCKKFNNNK